MDKKKLARLEFGNYNASGCKKEDKMKIIPIPPHTSSRQLGATQVDYILAAGIFILFFALAIQFITDYFSGVKDTTDTLTLRSQALDILTAADRGFDPAAWPQIANGSNDLVMLMHFNNNTLDYSGKGNNGTAMSGANCSSSVTGKFYSGCSFDGINDYTNISNSASMNISTGRTAEAWVKINSATATGGVFVFQNNNFGIYVESGGAVFIWLRPGDDANTGIELSLNTWHHIAVTNDAANTTVLYVNGVSSYIATRPPLNPTGNAFWIGSDTNGASNFFNGTIDEVAIYNRSLTASEILSHYQQGLNRLGLASHAYRFELIVNNTKPYLVNTSENATAQDLLNELVRFNLSYFGFNGIDYNSVVIYNSTGHGVPFMISGSNITFLINITANTSQKFTLYFDFGSVFGDKSRDVAGADNLTETLLPAEKIQLLQYHKLRHLNETNYTNIKNTAGIESGFSVKLYDIDDNTTFMTFGGSVPRSGDVVALQRYVLFQNSTAGIRNGRLTVQTW